MAKQRTNPLDTDAASGVDNEPLAQAREKFMKDAENILTEARAELSKAIAKVGALEQIVKDIVAVVEGLVPIIGSIALNEGSGSSGAVGPLKTAIEAVKAKLACPGGNCD